MSKHQKKHLSQSKTSETFSEYECWRNVLKVKSAFAAHENLDVINITYLKTNCFSFVSKTAQKLSVKVKFYKIRQRLPRSDGACSLAIVF